MRGSVSKRARARERGHIAACCGVLWRVVVVGVFVHNTRSEIGYIYHILKKSILILNT